MADRGIKEMVRLGVVLFLITAIAGLLLGVAYESTKDIIAEKKEAVNQAAYKEVLPEATALTKMELPEGVSENILEVYEDAAGYAMKVMGSGYGGDMEIAMGLTPEGEIVAVKIISSSETAGLGQKAGDESFKGQYTGKNASMVLEVTKQAASAENQIEAISGATITSDAVTAAINEGLAFYNEYLKEGQ